MNEAPESVWLVLVKAFAAAAPAFVLIYLTDEDFRREVDQLVDAGKYAVRRFRWRLVVWNRLEGWERELYESKHGPQE